MNLQTIVDSLISDTVQTSLPRFAPELTLCATIVVLLLAKVLPLANRIPPFLIALAGAIATLVFAVPQGGLGKLASIEHQELFTGMLVYDGVTVYLRLFLAAFAVLFVLLSRLTGIADRQDGQDYYCLVFGATIGMCLMGSANHILTLFLGVEMASVPSYALAGIVKGRSRSSEAALKYAVYGAGAAGVMLYGASLLAGVLGSVHFPTMARRLVEFDVAGKLADGGAPVVLVLALGGLMLAVGLAFKLSAVPFHFWCPDVFEGAAAEIGAFLSVASKAAALVLLLRVGMTFCLDPQKISASSEDPASPAAAHDSPIHDELAAPRGQGNNPSQVRFVAHRLEMTAAEAAPQVDAPAPNPLKPVRRFFVTLVAIVAAVTCTFGNLAAYGQKNIKRMLAYSTIAHAGFMMMPIAAAIAHAPRRPGSAADSVAAMLLYAAIYLFMNLGAFSIVAFLRNSMQSEEIKDYAGLIGRSPLLAVALTAILVSLIGLPPLAGFWPKLQVLRSLYEGSTLLKLVLVVAAFNTAISLIYYLRVAKTMCIDPAPDSSRPVELGFLPSAYIAALTLPIIYFGLAPNALSQLAADATRGLFH